MVNRQEMIGILKIMKLSYPNFYKDMTKETANDTIDIWSMMFADDEPQIVIEAIKSLVCTLKFPPSIADVKEKIRLITQPEEMTEQEAWNKVYNAISYYDAGQTFEALPEVLQKLVGSPQQLREWSQMDKDTVKSVVQSNFIRSYRARVEHDKQMQALPSSTRTLIANFSEKFKMIGA